jgi:hypothetical protein
MLFLIVALMICYVVLVAAVGRQGDCLVGVWGSGDKLCESGKKAVNLAVLVAVAG